MSEAVDHGITVTEIAAMDQPIDVSPETTAAFVGRALRGPLNTPVLVHNFAEFRRRFGGTWSRSSLGPAVEQFFQHGGQRLYIVRVANNARGAMICLPASGSGLVLRAIEPGSTERVRASVDYDGVEDDEDLFNLTLQRVNPDTGLVADQELFSRVSFREDSHDFVGEALEVSRLVRVEPPYPTHRPESSLKKGREFASTYVEPVQPGTDGTAPSDYDLIGSRKVQTGLFALEQVEDVDLLYLPLPGRGVDVGPAAILVAEQFCRDRGAMLVVDPDAGWQDAREAIDGVAATGFASPNMVGYFPRIAKRRADDEAPQAAGGAIAGLLCKLDRTHGAWTSLDRQGMGLHRSYSPALDIDEESAHSLARAGLNVIMPGPAGRARVRGSVTMSRGLEAQREFASLPVRRFCLRVANSIARAMRWAVFEEQTDMVRRRIRAQVLHFLHQLHEFGAFADERFVVECSMPRPGQDGEAGVTLLLAFRPAGCDDAISLTLHLTGAGCRVASTAFGPGVENCA